MTKLTWHCSSLHPTRAHKRNRIVAEVIKTGVTPKLIDRAATAPEQEWRHYQILRILGGGNPDHLNALTDLAMDEIGIAWGTVG